MINISDFCGSEKYMRKTGILQIYTLKAVHNTTHHITTCISTKRSTSQHNTAHRQHCTSQHNIWHHNQLQQNTSHQSQHCPLQHQNVHRNTTQYITTHRIIITTQYNTSHQSQLIGKKTHSKTRHNTSTSIFLCLLKTEKHLLES